MARLAKPQLSLWTTRFSVAAEAQREWRVRQNEIEAFYEQNWIVDGIPSGIDVTIPSTARAIVDESVDHSDFNPDWLKINLPTYGLTQDNESRSSKLRSFLIGFLAYQAEHGNDVSPYRDWLKNIYLHGKGVYKICADYDNWPSLDIPEGTKQYEADQMERDMSAEKEFAGIPAVLRSIYPLAMYEDLSVGEKNWAIEVYEYGAAEIAPLYEDWVPKTRGKNGSPLTREEMEAANPRLAIWDCYQTGYEDGKYGVWRQVLINETPIGSEQGYRPVEPDMISPANGPDSEPVWYKNEPFPYVIKFSGLGRQSSGKYEEKARGILTAVTSLLKAEARRLTQLDAIISQMAWPTIFVTGSRSRFTVGFGPNVVNFVPPGTTVTPVTPQIPAGPVQAALATIQSGIERGTFGSVIRGDKPPNTTSAAQLAILSGQARLRFGAISMQHQAALSEVSMKLGHIVKHVINEPVTIWQTDDTDAESDTKNVIKPSDIPDRLIVRYTITTDPAEARDREIQLASYMFEKGAIDLEEFRERCGIRNTAAMRRRVIRDKVLMESPAVIAALGEQYILESGYDLESLTLEKAMRDMLIIRRQQEMYQQIAGGQNGGMNPAGSQPGGQNIAPAPNGGAPGQGGAPPNAPQGGAVTTGELYGPSVSGASGGRSQLRTRGI